jgi:hypothetical protein
MVMDNKKGKHFYLIYFLTMYDLKIYYANIIYDVLKKWIILDNF